MAKQRATSALDFLEQSKLVGSAPVCAVYGDDSFLKREVLNRLRRQLSDEGDSEFSVTTVTGRDAEWRDVRDALCAVSLFGSGSRVVIVEDADPFVTRYRTELEDFVAKPAKDSVLVLEVKTWPGNTRLAKAVAGSGRAIECKLPTEARAKRWLVAWAKKQHGATLQESAVDALFELLPPELGILQQEVAKLALLTDDDATISLQLVQEHVGGWRTRTAWEMIDAVVAGDAATALGQLDRLLAAGEQPIGLLAQMAGTLRRFAEATQLIEHSEAVGRRLPLRAALEQAGVRSFKLAEAERQLRQIGRQRARAIGHWLLAADLAMKGHNSSPPRARLELERLITRLSRSAVPDAAAK